MADDLSFIVTLGFGFALLLIFAFLYVKDKEQTKKMRGLEKSITDLNKQMYMLTKKIKERELENDMQAGSSNTHLKQEIKDDLDRTAAGIYQSVEQLDAAFKAYQQQMEDKIAILDDRVKESTMLPNTATTLDEGKIIQMFQSGWSIDHIAKELRIGRGEVEFTLKLANLK